MTVITRDGVDYLRNYRKPNERGQKEQKYLYPRGTTEVLTEKIIQKVQVLEGDHMDLS